AQELIHRARAENVQIDRVGMLGIEVARSRLSGSSPAIVEPGDAALVVCRRPLQPRQLILHTLMKIAEQNEDQTSTDEYRDEHEAADGYKIDERARERHEVEETSVAQNGLAAADFGDALATSSEPPLILDTRTSLSGVILHVAIPKVLCQFIL